MASEDLLFHGKYTNDNKHILEYPVYEIVSAWPHGNWNVLCSLYGNSGYKETKEQCLDWVKQHIKKYVKLEDYIDLRSAKETLEKREETLTSVAKQHGYNTIEEALNALAVFKEQECFGHTGD